MSEGQKARLKSDKEAAETALESLKTTFTKEINDLKDTFTSGTKNKVLNALSKGDPDVKAKIELRYASLMKTGDYKLDEAGITTALTEAATLVTGNKPAPGFLDGMTNAGDKGNAGDQKGDVPETENSKAMRKALDIKDSDAAKYSGEIKK